MKRLGRIYVSYLMTALMGMSVAVVVFLIYGGIRTSGPMASVTWYAVGIAAAVTAITGLLHLARHELSNTAYQTASLLLARRIQRTEEPKSVSLVVACHNESVHAPILATELSALLEALSFAEAEVVAIDDASKDGTEAALVHEFKLLENQGISRATWC